MSYTKVVKYGDITLIYEYSRPFNPSRNRTKPRRSRVPLPRTKRSVQRSTQNFFRLVHHNITERPDLPVMVTLTTFGGMSLDEGYEALRLFFGRIRSIISKHEDKVGKTIEYIAVPEWQRHSGFLHYHALVWGLPGSYVREERSTRILQRAWRRGFLDVRASTYRSPRLAGYLAKYFSKSHGDQRTLGRRSYSASRKIYRPSEVGSNHLSQYLDELVDSSSLSKVVEYETMWLGRCRLSTYTNKDQQND